MINQGVIKVQNKRTALIISSRLMGIFSQKNYSVVGTYDVRALIGYQL